MSTRKDELTAELIDQAIARLQSCSPRDVAQSLVLVGVSFRAIVRVVAEAGARSRIEPQTAISAQASLLTPDTHQL